MIRNVTQILLDIFPNVVDSIQCKGSCSLKLQQKVIVIYGLDNRQYGTVPHPNQKFWLR